MQTIVFNADFGFALDGISPTHFKAGEKHTLPDSCADSAIQVGAAMRVDAPAPSIITNASAQQQPDVFVEDIPEEHPTALKKEKAAPKAKAKPKAKK